MLLWSQRFTNQLQQAMPSFIYFTFKSKTNFLILREIIIIVSINYQSFHMRYFVFKKSFKRTQTTFFYNSFKKEFFFFLQFRNFKTYNKSICFIPEKGHLLQTLNMRGIDDFRLSHFSWDKNVPFQITKVKEN